MKNYLKTMIAFVSVFALLAVSATAVVDVTYNFNTDHVTVEAFDCLDSTCSQVAPFSGSFPGGQSTDSAQITMRYPSVLASPYGYAVYYFANGYVPMESKATWNSNGNTSVFTTAFDVDFYQLDGCRAAIDDFEVINDAQANVPLVIHMDARMTADSHSAFEFTHNSVEYVPLAYAQDWYSSDLVVTLTIYDENNNIVEEQTRVFSKELGNAIPAGESLPVDFTWTPREDGRYRAVVKTTVTDNQCSSAEDQSSAKYFSVLEAMPRNQCYTLLNNLQADDVTPQVDQRVDISFTTISNHANDYNFNDPGFSLTPIPTALMYTIKDGAGMVVFSDDTSAGSASNSVDPKTASFSWTPTTAGLYTVTVEGNPSSSLCNGLTKTGETVTTELAVASEPRPSVHFQVVDAFNGLPVEGASIDLAGASAIVMTNENGKATVSSLEPGTYTYKITRDGYSALTGSVTLVDVDVNVFVALQPTNPQPGPAPAPTPSPQPRAEEEREDIGVSLSAIHIPNAYDSAAGDEIPVFISLKNNGDVALHDVKVAVIIQDLALRSSFGPFDLGRNDRKTGTIYVSLPADTAPGLYPVRVSLSSDEKSRVVHREIEVRE